MGRFWHPPTSTSPLAGPPRQMPQTRPSSSATPPERTPAPVTPAKHRRQPTPPPAPAFPHRPIAVGARPPATQRQFARVLNDHHITAGNSQSRARNRACRYLGGGYLGIAQKPRELHL